MKRTISLLVTAALALSLTACSPKAANRPFQPTLTNQLLEADAFSEPLEPLETDIAFLLYGLEEAGLTPEQLMDANVLRSSGATCEEAALLVFSDNASAQTAASALALYITAQIEANKSYRPAELPKLEQTVLECRGNTVLLLVANDYEVAHKLLTP